MNNKKMQKIAWTLVICLTSLIFINGKAYAAEIGNQNYRI